MCVCVCVCVCVLFLDLFQDDLRSLFNPHQVNHGDVQKAPRIFSLTDFPPVSSEVVLTFLSLTLSPMFVFPPRLSIRIFLGL